jgi:hypothetical protein
MRINRRKVMGLLAATAAGTGVSAQAQPQNPDAALQTARQERQFDAQRIATVKLPQTIEPAFRFRP